MQKSSIFIAVCCIKIIFHSLETLENWTSFVFPFSGEIFLALQTTTSLLKSQKFEVFLKIFFQLFKVKISKSFGSTKTTSCLHLTLQSSPLSSFKNLQTQKQTWRKVYFSVFKYTFQFHPNCGMEERHVYRFAAFCLASLGLCIWCKGSLQCRQFNILQDGSLVDAFESSSFISRKHAQPIMVLHVGFDPLRTFCHGVSGLCLLMDVFIGSGHLCVPAIILTAAEIVHDVSDLCAAVSLIGYHMGRCAAAAFGLTYLCLLAGEFCLWLGTCKYHENCRVTNLQSYKALSNQKLSSPTLTRFLGPVKLPVLPNLKWMLNLKALAKSDLELKVSPESRWREVDETFWWACWRIAL